MELNQNTQKSIEELSEEISRDLEAMREAFLDKLVIMHGEKYAKLVDAFANSHMFSQDILMVMAMADIPPVMLEQVRRMSTQFVSMWAMYATELAGIEDMTQVEEMMEMSIRLRDNMRGIMDRGGESIKEVIMSEVQTKH